MRLGVGAAMSVAVVVLDKHDLMNPHFIPAGQPRE